ncbi:MAG: glycosyltransferase family 39 protein [Candidatus Hydrogenedentes bacterium]|nr:glycosyltransferase family 39 protein [Candidatus Hydrogenedentota bacterium]
MSRLTTTQFLCLLLLAAFFAAFFELGRQDVWSANEGQRAAPPAEMLRSGHFLVPTLNGEIYLAKPPLLYWTIAGVYALTGSVSEWAARIPTAMCSVLLVLCVYLLFRKRAGEGPARWAALTLLASPYFLERSRWAELDVPLTFCTFLAVVLAYSAWMRALGRKKSDQSDKAGKGNGAAWGMALAAGAALGAATLLKGPVPYLFLFAGYVAFLAVEGVSPKSVLRRALRVTAAAVGLAVAVLLFSLITGLRVPFPAALVLLIAGWLWCVMPAATAPLRQTLPLFVTTLLLGVGLAAPWAVAVLLDQGWENIERLLNSEVVERTHTATNINSGSPFYYLIALPVMTLPWGFLFPLHASKRIWNQGDALYRFALVMGWFSIAIFSLIAGKEYEYVLPAVPFLLLPTAYHLACAESGKFDETLSVWLRRWNLGLTTALLVATVGLTVYGVVAEFHPLMVLESVTMTAVALAVAFWRGRGTGLEAPATYARMFVLALLMIVNALVITRSYHYRDEHSPKQLARLCRTLIEAGNTVESSKVYPEFTFYAAHPIREVEDAATVRARLAETAPYFYVTREKFVVAFNEGGLQPAPILSGPCTSKDLVLLGNAAAKQVFEHLPR